jgi:hypothetical protein
VGHELVSLNAGDNGGLIAEAGDRVRVVISDHLPHTTTACGSAPAGFTKLSKLLSETVLSEMVLVLDGCLNGGDPDRWTEAVCENLQTNGPNCRT